MTFTYITKHEKIITLYNEKNITARNNIVTYKITF